MTSSSPSQRAPSPSATSMSNIPLGSAPVHRIPHHGILLATEDDPLSCSALMAYAFRSVRGLHPIIRSAFVASWSG